VLLGYAIPCISTPCFPSLNPLLIFDQSAADLTNMSATKIQWGQLTTVLSIVLAATWAATQWTAASLGYQPELGTPWFTTAGWPVYPPYAFFVWWFVFEA
jgi:hypothetical protein